jgi:hypothetical protein
MEAQIAQQILENFSASTGIKTKWRPLKKTKDDGLDGHVQFSFQQSKLTLPAEVKKVLQPYQFASFLSLHKLYKDMLIIANEIQPQIKKNLKEHGINYIDGAGNAFIHHQKFLVFLEGKKEKDTFKSFKTKPFSKAGLKVIFQLLIYPDLVNNTIRQIADQADVSLDSVHKTLNGLKQLGYILPVDKDTVTWKNKKELLEKWMTEYDARLKPSIYIGSFRFLNEEAFLNWRDLPLKKGLSLWGGEAAGDLYTNYLKPAMLTIYTTESKGELMKNYRLMPDPKGYVVAYSRFWVDNKGQDNRVPPLLAYADLINSGDSRNIETAEKIYEQYLQGKF